MPAQIEPQVPDFSHYEAKSDATNRGVSYFMIGSLGLLSASVAKSTVTEFLTTMAASADVLAMAKVEIELGTIPEGKNVIIKWRGKPVFIRHRTQDEVQEARSTNWKALRDPQSDEARTKKPEWLVMVGVCTHLGCVPIGEAGDYGGWCVCGPFWGEYASSRRPYAGSARAMVPTTISVRFVFRFSQVSWLTCVPNSRTCSQGSRPCESVCIVSGLASDWCRQTNLEVPQHDFDDANGLLVIG